MRFRSMLMFVLLSAIAPRVPAQRTLIATREFTISAEKQSLSKIDVMWVSAKGIMAIPQPRDNVIRFFDIKGAPLGTFGHDGGGPGEFRDPNGPGGWTGDTVWVWDQSLTRVTYISPSLKLLRTHPAPGSLLSPTNRPEVVPSFSGNSHIDGVFPNGDLRLFVTSRNNPAWLPLNPNAFSYVESTPDGHFKRLAVSIVPAPRTEACSSPLSGLCPRPWFSSTGGHGVVLANLEGQSATLGHYRVLEVNSERGDTTFNRLIDYRPVPVSTHVKDSIQAIYAKILSRPNIDVTIRRTIETVKFPEFFPPLISVLLGSDGSVWLEERTASTTTHHWLVLDAKGTPIGTVDIPLRISIYEVTRDTFWGTDTDADGLQDIVRYRVR